jgi:hypothetical protein
MLDNPGNGYPGAIFTRMKRSGLWRRMLLGKCTVGQTNQGKRIRQRRLHNPALKSD